MVTDKKEQNSNSVGMDNTTNNFIKKTFGYLVSFFQRAFDYKGIATKSEFVISFVFYFLMFTGLGVLFFFTGWIHFDYLLFFILTFQIPAIALSVRRCNDINNEKCKKTYIVICSILASLVIGLSPIILNIILGILFPYHIPEIFSLDGTGSTDVFMPQPQIVSFLRGKTSIMLLISTIVALVVLKKSSKRIHSKTVKILLGFSTILTSVTFVLFSTLGLKRLLFDGYDNYINLFVMVVYLLSNLTVFFMGLQDSNHNHNSHYEYEKQKAFDSKKNKLSKIKTFVLLDFFERMFDFKGITTKREFFTSFMFYWWIFIAIAIVLSISICAPFEIGVAESYLYLYDPSFLNRIIRLQGANTELGTCLKYISLFVMVPSVSLIWRRFNDMNIKYKKHFSGVADFIKNKYQTIIFALLFIMTGFFIWPDPFVDIELIFSIGYLKFDFADYIPWILGIILVLYCSLLPSKKRGDLLNKQTLIVLSVAVYLIWVGAISASGVHNEQAVFSMPLIMFGIVCALCSGPSNYDDNPHYEYEKKRLQEIENRQKEAEQEAQKANEYNESIKASVGLDNLEKAAKLYKQKLITKEEFEDIKKQCLGK